MSRIADIENVRSYYNGEVDVLEIEFGDARRTATIAYEDLVLLHFGTLAERPSELVLQGMTFIGFRRVREGIHGAGAGDPEAMARACRDLVANLEIERQPDGKAVIKDTRHWGEALKLRTRISPHLELVHDVRGDSLGIVIEDANGLDEAAIEEFFDLVFSAILPTDDEGQDAMRLATAKRVAARWAVPFYLAAA